MTVELLSAEYSDDGEGNFRFLVDKSIVKYVDIDGGIYDPEIMGVGFTLVPQLPDFPPGTWNKGRISKDSSEGKGYFSHLEETVLPAVTTVWHSARFDILQLSSRILIPSIRRVSNFHCPAVLKYPIHPRFMNTIEKETAMYQWLEGTGIAPRFLGHVTENDRVVGFLLEEIVGARHAGPTDFKICQQALARIHQLGIQHGDINKFNFLIQNDRVFVIDFADAKREAGREELDKEMAHLEIELNDPGYRGGLESWMETGDSNI